MKFKLDENLGAFAAAVLIEVPGPAGRLWIVHPGRVRRYQGGPEE